MDSPRPKSSDVTRGARGGGRTLAFCPHRPTPAPFFPPTPRPPRGCCPPERHPALPGSLSSSSLGVSLAWVVWSPCPWPHFPPGRWDIVPWPRMCISAPLGVLVSNGRKLRGHTGESRSAPPGAGPIFSLRCREPGGAPSPAPVPPPGRLSVIPGGVYSRAGPSVLWAALSFS